MNRIIKKSAIKQFYATNEQGDNFISNTAIIIIRGSNFEFQAHKIPMEAAMNDEEIKKLMAASLRNIIEFIES